MDEIFNILLKQIDLPVAILIVAAGFFAKNYLSAWEWPVAWKTLIVSIIFVAIYTIVLIIDGNFCKQNLDRYILTYFATTSFYELLLKYVFQLASRINIVR